MDGHSVSASLEGFERLDVMEDATSGLKAIIAIDQTKLGPALGGCRMWMYASEEAAIGDALRLARGMTYKSALAGIPYGGGKAVIIGNPAMDKSSKLFRSLGRFIERLNGRYITGMDLGTTPADMDEILHETRHVTDVTGSLGATGNFTAEMTAYGVYIAIRMSLKQKYGSEQLQQRTVAVQGLGKVGFALCRYLHQSGAQLIVADLDNRLMQLAASQFGAVPIAVDAIHKQHCDVFAPCALGGILNDLTIPELECQIIAGAANNQLAEPRHDALLEQAAILYAPDYAINAGGIIVTAAELDGSSASYAQSQVERIGDTLAHIYARSAGTAPGTLPPAAAADAITRKLIGL